MTLQELLPLELPGLMRELHNQCDLCVMCRMKDLEGLEIEGDRVLEVGGLDVLTVSREDWTNLQPHLRFPLPVLALREQRNTPGPNISLKYVGRGAVGWRCYINNVSHFQIFIVVVVHSLFIKLIKGWGRMMLIIKTRQRWLIM